MEDALLGLPSAQRYWFLHGKGRLFHGSLSGPSGDSNSISCDQARCSFLGGHSCCPQWHPSHTDMCLVVPSPSDGSRDLNLGSRSRLGNKDSDASHLLGRGPQEISQEGEDSKSRLCSEQVAAVDTWRRCRTRIRVSHPREGNWGQRGVGGS